MRMMNETFLCRMRDFGIRFQEVVLLSGFVPCPITRLNHLVFKTILWDLHILTSTSSVSTLVVLTLTASDWCRAVHYNFVTNCLSFGSVGFRVRIDTEASVFCHLRMR